MELVTDNASTTARSVKKFTKMDVLPENEANEDGNGLDKVFDGALSEMVDFSTTHMRRKVHTLQLSIRHGLKEKHVDRLSVKFVTLL